MEYRDNQQQGGQNGRGRIFGGQDSRYRDEQTYGGRESSRPHYNEGYEQDFGGQYGSRPWQEDRRRHLEERYHPGPHYGAFEHERYLGQDHQTRYREAYEGDAERSRYGARRFDDVRDDSRRRQADSGRVDYGDDRRNRFGYGGSEGYGPYTAGPGYSGESQPEASWQGRHEEGFSRAGRGQYGRGELYNQYGAEGFNQFTQGSRGRLRRGQFYGKGPRGFSYSDEDIRRDISRALYEHGEIDASDIDVQVKNGEVTLTGTVDSRSTKNQIEELIEDEIHGVKDLNNQVRVKRGILSSLFSSDGESEGRVEGSSGQTQPRGSAGSASTDRGSARKDVQ